MTSLENGAPGENCPSANEVAGLAAGTLDEQERRALDAHLDKCVECRCLVAEIAPDARSESAHGAPPFAANAAFLPGRCLGGYVIGELLGRGGMGAVYRALDVARSREVALKVLDMPLASDAARRLRREVDALAALTHRNIVGIYEHGDAAGALFFAMELVNGKTLRAVLADRTHPPLATRLRWLASIADALRTAHRAGFVHRDIKPENVMIDVNGDCKVLDFGLARPGAGALVASGETFTQEGAIVGTALYMAPEQLRAERVDGRADQFAWGVLAYEALTGRRPWRAMTPGALLAEIAARPPARPRRIDPAIPMHVEAAVMRALQREASDRFEDMGALVAACRAGDGGRGRRATRIAMASAALALMTFLCAREATKAHEGEPPKTQPSAGTTAPTSMATATLTPADAPVREAPTATAPTSRERARARAMPAAGRGARIESSAGASDSSRRPSTASANGAPILDPE